VAKLRALKTDDNPLLLKTNMGAGHGGASGRYDYLREIAFDYAFILTQLGLQT
jgi:oligopeptidase B